MRKSVKIRKIIYEILNDIYKKNLNYEQSFLYFTKNISLSEQERSMIFNVTLNSMRLKFYINNILKKYLKKTTKNKVKILILSAITQIVYLDFKDYAVTNDTVEVAKIKKLNPGLVNSLLKNIINNKGLINLDSFDYSDLPNWFLDNIKKNNNKINIEEILKNISKEPSLHLVFKSNNFVTSFDEEYQRTSMRSVFVLEKKKINEISGFFDGNWWVQDFSSMLPIHLSPEIKGKKIIDLCSAPGGKAFQAISMGGKVRLNDISLKKLNILKQNLNRLKISAEISNLNALDILEEEKFDVVILDSPCSGIGTIRRNPEILFKKEPPNLDKLTKIQNSLIFKASKLLKNGGILIYMVCSFFYDETEVIKNNFLQENKNFSQKKFKLDGEDGLSKFINNEGDIYCIPSTYKNYMIDGFYACKFIKND